MFNKGVWLHVIRGGFQTRPSDRLEVLHLLITVVSPAARAAPDRTKKATGLSPVALVFPLHAHLWREMEIISLL